MIRYSILRVLVFFGCLSVLWLLGLRSPDQSALLLLGAALLSLPVSYVVLRPFREDYSRQIAERLEARRAATERRVSDEDVEDAAIERNRGAGAAGSTRPGPAVEADGSTDSRDDFR
jgi:hypothetical protein